MVFAAESLFSLYCEDRLTAASLGQTPPTTILPKEPSILDNLLSFRQRSRGDPPSPPPQPPPSPTGWTKTIPVKDDLDVVRVTWARVNRWDYELIMLQISIPGWY